MRRKLVQICNERHCIILQHPDYDQGLGFTPNDISVVQASSDISGSNISPATIAPNANNPGGNGWITGWGRTCKYYKTVKHIQITK